MCWKRSHLERFASLNSHIDRVKVYTQPDGKVSIHPKSVNAEEQEFNYKWLIYHLKMRTSSVSRRGLLLGPAFKGWQRRHVRFTLNEYFIKSGLSTPSKATALQSFRQQRQRCCPQGRNSRCSCLTGALCLFSSSLLFSCPSLFVSANTPLTATSHASSFHHHTFFLFVFTSCCGICSNVSDCKLSRGLVRKGTATIESNENTFTQTRLLWNL